MREIKFRAWDGSKMVVPACIGEYGEWYETGRDYENGIGEKEGLMQSTGLKDKNGKEIFEGDIFRVEEQADDRMYYLVIHWIKEWCMFGCLTVGEYTDYLATGISALDEPMFWTYTLEDTDSQKFFLCGNVHQNPKLIEP